MCKNWKYFLAAALAVAIPGLLALNASVNSASAAGVPMNGDETPIAAILILMGLSLAGVIVLIIAGKKKKW